MLIYNVIDDYTRDKSALQIDSLESFVISEDVYYFSLWQYKGHVELEKIKEICSAYRRRKILFDPTFNIRNDDTLYCSEFCVKVLNELDVEDLDFRPVVLQLRNSLYESVLERNILIYYPVDFFQTSSSFAKKFEYVFKY